MITFENVSKKYADGTKALNDISFRVREGELLTLIGPSGCGKTTTMKMINRLIEPSEGTISIDGEDISRMNPVELRRNTGYVIQQIGLLPHMTIAENVALVPKLKKWPKEKYEKRVDELLELVGLDPSVFRERYPFELSGGQQQRIGVIRALAGEPPVILMDEPFSALDPISREQLQDELVRLQQEIHKTIVFVTHDMDEAIKIADRIVIMKEGEILQIDDSDHILRRPANDFVREFIGEDRLSSDDSSVTAKSLMMEKVAVARPTRGLAEGLELMKSYRVDSLYITDKDHHFQGVVFLDTLEDHYREEEKRLQDIMETNVPIVPPEVGYSSVAEIFSDSAVRTIPVVENDKLVGLITRSSMMRGLAGLTQRNHREGGGANG
ncbi:MAG TPA: betaine/proline/choline family ABC transporter ATP-binding protein [Bacillales bacterium]|nr:betaine/proline/choline family ABC transporter ATP-binding protein [Bacillales bacterium]